MSTKATAGIRSLLMRHFHRGARVVLPGILVFIIGYWIVHLLSGVAAIPIGFLGDWLGISFASATALLIAIFIGLCIIFGVFLTTTVGQWLHELLDELPKHIPVVGRLYSLATEFAAHVYRDDNPAFRQTALVRWAGGLKVGFVVETDTESGLTTIFVPTAPTVWTGFPVCFSSEQFRIIDTISPAVAFRVVVSCGVGMEYILQAACTQHPEWMQENGVTFDTDAT